MERGRFSAILFFFVYFVGTCRGLNQTYTIDPIFVIGGQPVEIQEIPYQSSLEMRTKEGFLRNCGASVISEMWAITAADCIPTLQISDYRLRAGSSIRNHGGEVYELEKIVVHPKYDCFTADYDIAVLQVSSPFRFSEVLQPIKLAKTTPSSGTDVVLTGWGCLNNHELKTDQLHKAILNVGYPEVCYFLTSFWGQIMTPRMGCVVRKIVPRERDENDCTGDSGSPLATLQNELMGVRSSNMIISHTIFTDIASLREWITQITGTT